jgi:hypothetical protein
MVVGPEALTLGYDAGNVLESAMRSPDAVQALRGAAREVFGREPVVNFQTVAPGFQTLAEADKRAREQRKRAAVDRAEQHPSVKEAAEILGARVKRIEIGES